MGRAGRAPHKGLGVRSILLSRGHRPLTLCPRAQPLLR